jgi:CspA family cold shock protein
MATSPARKVASFQQGVVSRLNRSAEFGYVSDRQGEHVYIFVFGSALPRREAARLAEGSRVKFRVSGEGRVDELVLA